jgi:pimeloyl-ACP methyl ester carboxylesterase
MLKSTSPPWSAVGAPTTAALNNYNTNRHPFAKKLCYHSSVEHRAGFKEDLVEVVLIGHNYGGMVATGVADRARDRVSQLIY